MVFSSRCFSRVALNVELVVRFVFVLERSSRRKLLELRGWGSSPEEYCECEDLCESKELERLCVGLTVLCLTIWVVLAVLDFVTSYSFSLDKERDLALGQHSTEDCEELRSREEILFASVGDGVECLDDFLASDA